MFTELNQYFNFTQLFVVLTFGIAVIYLSRSTQNRILLAILSVCLLNECLSILFVMLKIENGTLFTANSAIHNCLWIVLIMHITKYKLKTTIFFYIAFAIVNMLFIEGLISFNYYTFMLGAFVYIIVYIYMVYINLKKEEFSFFSSRDFVLLSAPILFFFGLSFIFGFKSETLSSTILFNQVVLYDLVGIIVNSIYYLLICVYIFQAKRIYHA